MSNTAFRMDVKLKTPAIIQGHLTLESLLAAAVYERTGLMRDEALAKVPLTSINHGDDKIWMASSVFLEGGVRRDRTTIIRRRTRDEMGPDFYEPNMRARKVDPFFVDQSKGDFKALLNTYPTYAADQLVWYFEGVSSQCAELIASLAFIGKRRGQGFGEIGDVLVRAVDENPIVDANGIVRRPIPVHLLPLIQGSAPKDRQKVLFTVAQHPFYGHKPVLCAVPPSNVLELAHAESPEGGQKEVFFE